MYFECCNSILQDDKEEAVRHLQGVLAARRHNPILAHHGHGSPNSESSGYMSNVSPQQMRVGSASPNSCDDVLDLSTDRRHSSSGNSSRYVILLQTILMWICNTHKSISSVSGHLQLIPSPQSQFKSQRHLHNTISVLHLDQLVKGPLPAPSKKSPHMQVTTMASHLLWLQDPNHPTKPRFCPTQHASRHEGIPLTLRPLYLEV